MPENHVYFTLQQVPDRAVQPATGRTLLGQLAARLEGRPADSFRIATETSGRPILTWKDGSTSGVFVSLSHSGSHLACAVTRLGPVGIDIERPRPGRDLAGIAEAAFGPDERLRCQSENPDSFYRIWTLREAIAKALGSGLAMVGDRQDRAASGPAEGGWRWQEWHLAHFRRTTSQYLALAVRPVDPELTEVDWREINLSDA